MGIARGYTILFRFGLGTQYDVADGVVLQLLPNVQ